jgi:hypothetical protein
MSIEVMKQALDTLDRLWEIAIDAQFDIPLLPSMQALRQAIEQAEKEEPEQVSGDTSDGYHTFNELYEFRKAYNAALFNEWAASNKYSVHKSKRHFDGEDCFGGGWFIVVAQLPDGQISNHYEMKDWDKFLLPETDKAMFEYDNHTGADVLQRLFSLRQAIEQAEKQEPAAEIVYEDWGKPFNAIQIRTHFFKDVPPVGTKLYTAPPRKEWVGLTDEEFRFIASKYLLTRETGLGYFQEEIEEKLKEKNT